MTSVFGQVTDYSSLYWLFGQSKYGITYKKSDFSAQLDSIQNPVFGTGGSAVATDPYSGDLLFYSDGSLVYDRGHQLISGYTAGLNGNTSGDQPALVAAVPGQANFYFIISNSASTSAPGSIFAARINMNLQGNAPLAANPGYGVMQNTFNTQITANASEGMAVVAAPGGSQYWLITHERGTAVFNVTPVNSVGIDNTKTTTYDFSSRGFPPMEAANLCFSQAVNKLAVSPRDTSLNVQILDFSVTSGTLAYDTVVYNSANRDVSGIPGDDYSIYDTEWSGDGSKLYISRHGGAGITGMVYQYDVNNLTFTLATILQAPVYRSYGLKRGPDNNIYHIYQTVSGGPLLVGRISNADSLSAAVVYIPAFFGNINFDGRQFSETMPFKKPNFVNAAFTYFGTCYGTSTKFFPTINPPADSYLWNFGDGANSNEISPVHKYSQPGSYNITLTASLGGQDTIMTGALLISQSDTLVLKNSKGSALPTDTTICPGETLLLDASQPPAAGYLWSVPGVTTPTYTVDSAGYYWAVATYNSPSGTCTSYDAINVTVYNFQLQVSNQWYFGHEAGIDFNKRPAVALTNGAMDAPAGCAAISDRNGRILFYTNGDIVYGRTGQILGQFIGGNNTATQSALAIPFPNDETMYYIFTTKEIPGDNTYMLDYSVLDIKQSLGADPGKVIIQALPLYSKNTERLAAIGGYGNNATLLAHEYGNNTFRLYPITANGIGTPVLQSIGSVHAFGSTVSPEGYMKFSQDGTKLAVAVVSGNNNFVDLFDYNDTTKTITNFRQITFQETYPQFQVYGVEFSPRSNKLFVSLTGSTSLIYEFRLDSADINFINQTRNQLNQANQQYGALQLGPDGQIYVAVENSPSLARISPNPDPTLPSIFIQNGFNLSGKSSALGLPNFIQNLSNGVGSPSASVSGLCVGQPTNFTGQPSSSIDQFQWQVKKTGDTTVLFTSTNLQDTYTFPAAGNYTVSFRDYNRCGLDTTITQNITIKDTPPKPTLPAAFAICTGNEILQALPAGTTGYNYLWNDGSTGRTIQVKLPGIYSVIISYQNPQLNGCTSDSSTLVADGRPPFDLGPDLTVCRNTAVADLNTGLTPASYNFAWRVNGVFTPGDTLTNHPVKTDTTGNFRYTVKVDDKLTACFRNDTVTITVSAIPNGTYVVAPSTCGNNDGSVTMSGMSPNSNAFLYDQNGASTALTNLAAGSYSLVIQDQINGCSTTYNVVISDVNANITVTPTPVPGCVSGQIQVALTNEVYPLKYTLSGTNNSQVFNGTVNIDDPNPAYAFLINSVQPGTFNLQVISAGCTLIQPSVILMKKPTAGLDISPNYPNCQTTLVINPDPNGLYPGQNYFWNGPGVAIDFQSPVLTTTRGGAFTVRASTAGQCDTTGSFQINLYQAPIVKISASGNGCGAAIQLTAQVTNPQPGNTYSYLWTNNQVSDIITLPSPSATDSVNYLNYSVKAVTQQTGCQGSDGPYNYTTYLPYSVFLTSTIACADGKPVTLTANILNISSGDITAYGWTGPEPNIDQQNKQIVQVTADGKYTVDAKWHACDATAFISVVRSPVTKSDILPYYSICTEPPANESVILTPGDFVTFSLINLNTNETVPELQPGTYELQQAASYAGSGINGFGCATNDTFQVEVKCIPTLYAPNAFHPGSSIEKNQTFSIDGLYLDDNFQVIIYNRWGEIVYESRDKNFKWDGTSRDGKLLPNDTYAYVIHYHSITDSSSLPFRVKRGGVLILR